MKCKKYIVVFLTIFLLSIPANALPEPWTTTDLALEGSAVALMTIDLFQSLYIADHPERYYEQNLVLGSHPSPANVALYFGVLITSHIFIADLLPSDYRKYWAGLFIIIEGYSVVSNRNIGIGFSF